MELLEKYKVFFNSSSYSFITLILYNIANYLFFKKIYNYLSFTLHNKGISLLPRSGSMPWFSSQIHLHEQNHRSSVAVQPRLKSTSLKGDTALEPGGRESELILKFLEQNMFFCFNKKKNQSRIKLYIHCPLCKSLLFPSHSRFLDTCLISMCHICCESLV